MISAAVFPLADPSAPELFDAGELALLRDFVGLPPVHVEQAVHVEPPSPACDPDDEDEEEDEEDSSDLDLRRSPVRLSDAELEPSSVPLVDIQLAEAVGRLCTSAVRKRLATWYQPETTGLRTRFPRQLARLLRPRLLFTINWSSWEWGEQYEVTWIQPLERFIVTVVSDTTEIWGCTRLALGSFGRDEPLLPACRRILSGWWEWHRDLGREEGWSDLRRTGSLDRRSALRLRRSVWDGPGYEEPRVVERTARVKRAPRAAPVPALHLVQPPAPNPDPFQHERLKHLEGRQFDCVRCSATGTIHRRVSASHPYPPWYVEWARPQQVPPNEPTIQCEAQVGPMAHSFCPACRSAGPVSVPPVL